MNEEDNIFSNEEEEIITNAIHNKIAKSYERSLLKHFPLQIIIIIIGGSYLSLNTFIVFACIVIIMNIFLLKCIYRNIAYNASNLIEEICDKKIEDPLVSIDVLLEQINNSKL